MSETIVVDFQANTEKATSNINKVADATKDAKKATVDYGDTVDNLTGGLVSSFKSGLSQVKNLVTGFKTLRGAIAATGIGALVIAVTAAVEWFANFESGVKLAEKAMNVLGAVVGQLGTALNALLDGDFGGAADAIKDIGNAAQEAARQTDLLFDAQKRLFEIQKNNIVENENLRQELELQKRILEDTTLSANERLAALEKVRDISIEIQENIIAETEAMKAETEAMLANENNYEKRRELQLKLSEIQADLIRQNGELALIEKDAQRVEREIYTLQRENRNRQLEEEVRLRKELAELTKADIEEDTAESDLDFLDKQFEAFQKDSDRRIFTKKQETDVIKGLNENLEAQQDEILKNNQLREESKVNMAAQGFSSLINLSNQFQGTTEEQQEKAFKRNKSLAIAETLISVFQAAQGAFTGQTSVPEPTAIFRAAAAAATAIASGLARLRQIRQTQFNSASAVTSGSSFNGASISSATGGSSTGFQGSTISAIPQFTNTTTGNTQTGVRAYVIQNDITDQQALAKRLDQRATL